MTKQVAKIVKMIVALFSNLNGSSFVAIKGYESKTTGEIANHVVIADFSYANAVEHDLNALKNAVHSDLEAIVTLCTGKSIATNILEVKQLIDKLATSFENNQNDETRSAGSQAQLDTYLPITNSIKLNLTTGMIHIYALAHSKVVLVEGLYKSVNSRNATLIQNEIKKYFDFKTTKYRNFIVAPEQMAGVNILGEKVTF